MPHVTLEGNRPAASWLTQDLHMVLKLRMDTMLSGSLVLICQLLPMSHSRSKSEDCAREEQKTSMPCTAAPYKIQNDQIPPHTHTHIYTLYTPPHPHTHTDLPKQVSLSNIFSNSPQVFALVHYKLFSLFLFSIEELFNSFPSQIPFKPIP